MRKQSHHVEQIQSILIIISRVDDRNIKKCEIYQGTKSNQINQIQVIPPSVGVCLERRVENSIFDISVS